MKVEGERQLAAVEKVKDSVYTLYKLSTQLKMKDVRKTFAQVKKSRQNSESLHGGVNFTPEILGSEWWSGLATPGPGFPVGGLCTSESTIKLIMGSSDLDNYDDRPPSPYANFRRFFLVLAFNTNSIRQTSACKCTAISASGCWCRLRKIGNFHRAYSGRHLGKN